MPNKKSKASVIPLKDNLDAFLKSLPLLPGVYQMLDAKDNVIYVGKAINLKNRVTSYFKGSSKDIKTQSLVQQIYRIEITVTHTENEAVLLECSLIKQLRPKYNILMRDDKSFPYIVLSAHAFPRIGSYRGSKKAKEQYFGPYPDGKAVKDAVRLIQKVFRLRTCRDTYFATRKRPCLLYQIERCDAPCVSYIDQEHYASQVTHAKLFLQGKSERVMSELMRDMDRAAALKNYEEAAHYRDEINQIRKLQERQTVMVGASSVDVIAVALDAGVAVVHMLCVREGRIAASRSYYPSLPLSWTLDEVMTAFIKQYYLSELVTDYPDAIILPVLGEESAVLQALLQQQSGRPIRLEAATRGHKKQWMTIAKRSAIETLNLHLSQVFAMRERFLALQKLLQLKTLPQSIECFDISHTQGEETIGSCVVFNAGGPVRSAYRRFIIKSKAHGDDLMAMRETLQRRYGASVKGGGDFPELIIIDGGPTQLNAALSVLEPLLKPNTTVIAISKGVARKPGLEKIHKVGVEPFQAAQDDAGLHLLQHIRDEAHRFAITGHRARLSKNRKVSKLEQIPGIGRTKRLELLRYFGGIQGVACATLEQLCAVPGINLVLAKRIFVVFHHETL